jgi:hypothetical protein
VTHRRKFISIVLAVAIAFIGAIVPTSVAHAANGSISGVVTVGGTVQSGVDVKLWNAAHSYTSKTTNAAGEYSFSVSPGDYRIEFVGALGSANWQGSWWQGQGSSATATVIPVASGQAVTGIDGVLARADGSISGTPVAPYPAAAGGGYAVLEQCSTGLTISKYTGTGSTVTFSQLPPGDYLLRFRGEAAGGIDSWHSNSTTRTNATPISVGQGATITGADVAAHFLGTVSGGVRNASGSWVPSWIYVFDLQGNVVAQTTTSGSFVVSGVPAGQYIVHAQPMVDQPYARVYSGNSGEFHTATPVTVVNDEWTTVQLVAQPSSSVSGKVTANGAGVPGVNVAFIGRDAHGAFTSIEQLVSTDANGNYQAPGLGFGPYKLMVYNDNGASWPWPYGQPPMTTVEAQFWPSASSLWTASSFTIPAGTNLARNVTMQPVTGQTAIGEPSVAPSIAGNAIGGTLTADTGTWGISGLTFAYQWRVGGIDVDGANAATFTAGLEYAYQPVTVVVSATKAGHLWRQVESAPVVLEHADAAGAFADVSSASPFYANIEWMAANGISTGSVNEPGRPLFKPEDSISRMAFAAFLYRYSGVTFTPPTTPTFGDVTSANPFYTAIEWMAAEGITNGNVSNCGKLNFLPEDPISRQAAAAFLSRFAGASVTTPEEQRFADVPVDGTFAAAIDWMGANGISTGNVNPDGGLPLYAPLDPISRQAVAAFLARYDALP